jgi:hypothetical protein
MQVQERTVCEQAGGPSLSVSILFFFFGFYVPPIFLALAVADPSLLAGGMDDSIQNIIEQKIGSIFPQP